MKKIIFVLLLLATANLSAIVVVPHTNPAIYAASHRHSTEAAAVDNSMQSSLTRKDYHFSCKKCGKDFVISNMLYHEGTDMYFCYESNGYGLKILQPYEGRKLCDKCESKQALTITGFVLIIVFLGVFIGILF